MGKERKKRKSAVLPGVLILYGLMLLAALLFVLDGRHVRFYMRGAAETELPVGTAYTEPGCRAVSAGRIFGEGRRELPVTVSGEVDGERLGDYERSYTARWLFWEYRALRHVHVTDRTPPVITLQRREGYAPRWLDGYEEEGYTAEDNIDGDLTNAVRREVRGETVVYTVTDAAGNTGETRREIPYSEGLPKIEPGGGTEPEIPAALHFLDPGVKASDGRGRDYTALLQIEGEVDPTRPGVYERVFSLENARGETVSVTQRVHIVPAALPAEDTPAEKTMYLSFDDGPGPYTGQLLDVLKEYGVKATFFVTCRYPDYFDMVGRACREGHVIGVHSASHDYDRVYASERAYYDDFEACQAMIREQTGRPAEIFRFPGGSSNTVSAFNEGIMSRLTADMNAMGYQYFDWNVDSDDAGKTNSTAGVLKNIEDGCAGKDVCLVLQHDVKPFSVAAVRQVIEWALENGYRFETLSPTAPGMHHPVAN